MPLPTSTSGFFAFGRAGVAQHDQLGRLARAARDRQQRAHAELLHVAALEHFDAELELLGELPRLVGEVGGRAQVRRQVAQRARQVGAVGRGGRLLEGGLRLLRDRRAGDGERHRRERRGGRLVLRLELVEAVERRRAARARPCAPSRAARGRRRRGPRPAARRPSRRGVFSAAPSAAQRLAQRGRVEFGALAQAAAAARARRRARPRRAAAAWRPPSRRGRPARARGAARPAPPCRRPAPRARGFAALHGEHQAAGLRLLGRQGPYAKLHRFLL